MSAKSELRLGYSGLTGNVYVGKMREKIQNGVSVLTCNGNKTDVTDDFKYAIVLMAGKSGKTTFTVDGKHYALTVKRIGVEEQGENHA